MSETSIYSLACSSFRLVLFPSSISKYGVFTGNPRTSVVRQSDFLGNWFTFLKIDCDKFQKNPSFAKYPFEPGATGFSNESTTLAVKRLARTTFLFGTFSGRTSRADTKKFRADVFFPQRPSSECFLTFTEYNFKSTDNSAPIVPVEIAFTYSN